MLGELPGQDETDSGLDVPGGDGDPLVVLGKLGSLSSELLEDVIGERIHNTHGLGGDPDVRMDLLENFEDEGGVGVKLLLPLGLLSPLGSRAGSLLLDNLWARNRSFLSGSGGHPGHHQSLQQGKREGLLQPSWWSSWVEPS